MESNQRYDMVNFSIVSCTKHDRERFKDTPLHKSMSKMGMMDRLHVFYENKKGLSYCYNAFLDICKTDYIIFAHDDAYMMDLFFEEKLEAGFKLFDVFGVAGSSDLSLSRLPLAWNNSPKESWSGGIFHSSVNGQDDICGMYVNSYGKFGRKCVSVDGVFIAVNIAKLNGVRFQEEFEFDFYDMAFCLECYKKGVSVGTVPIALCHMSHGEGILRKEYNDAQNVFLNKYRKE
jgi:hypothetical protein